MFLQAPSHAHAHACTGTHAREGSLRPYQEDALDRLREQFRLGRKRVVLYSPTGSGKTEMAIEMIRGGVRRGRGVMFVCHRVELVAQASRRLHASGIDHGLLQGQNTHRIGEQVIVGSIQTVARRGVPQQVGMLVVDECHACAGSKEYVEMFRSLSALPAIGLSATPFSRGMAKEHQDLGPLFESIVVASTIRELIDDGYLVDCDIYAPSEPDLAGVKITAGDYNERQLGECVDKPALIGDIVEHWKALGRDQQTVVFATNIAHSRHIVEEFTRAGISADHIDAYTSDEDRRSILRRHADGDIRVISNCAVLAEGWDSPATSVMILARPTKSLTRWIQMCGRALRPCQEIGKERALILDHSGTCKRLGFPTDDLPLELDDGKPRSTSSGTNGRDDPLPKECPSCKYVKPAKVHKCPKCGFAPQKRSDVEVQDGVLRKMSRGAKIATADRNQVYAELRGFARDRGMKDGWAWYACRDLFGSAPRVKPAPVAPSDDTVRLIKHLQIKRANARAAA